MVESLGWFYSLPLIGKTLFTSPLSQRHGLVQTQILASRGHDFDRRQACRGKKWTRCSPPSSAPPRAARCRKNSATANLNLSLERLEFLRRPGARRAKRRRALAGGALHALSARRRSRFRGRSPKRYGINQARAFARMERITRTGFTLQRAGSYGRNRARIMGLTRNFARSCALLRPRQPLRQQSLRSRPRLRRLRRQLRQAQRAGPRASWPTSLGARTTGQERHRDSARHLFHRRTTQHDHR